MSREPQAKNSNFLDPLEKSGWIEFEHSEVILPDLVARLSADHSTDFRVEKAILTPHDTPSLGKSTLSGRFGYGKFPYHSDGAFERIPPRFIIFNYLSDLISAAGTLLLDLHEISISSSEFRKHLHYDVYRLRAHGGAFYTSIARKVCQTERPLYRYNPLIMDPADQTTNSFEAHLANLEGKRIV